MNDKTLKSTTVWTILNMIFLLATLGVNYLGATGFFNGMSQKDVSDKYSTLLTPAGFAFSIWGLIYTLVFISLVYFIVKRKNVKVSQLVNSVSPLFVISSLLNMGWIIAFSYELVGLSTLFIIGMVISLFLIVEKTYKNQSDTPYTFIGLSFTLYSAWVFIASILNVAIFLVQQDWGGFGISDSIWAIIIIIVAIAFPLIYMAFSKNAVFPISLAWAFFGIYSSYSSGQLEPPKGSFIQLLLLLGIGIFIVAIIIRFIKNNYSVFPKRI